MLGFAHSFTSLVLAFVCQHHGPARAVPCSANRRTTSQVSACQDYRILLKLLKVLHYHQFIQIKAAAVGREQQAGITITTNRK
jgi:hypothetical protein